ncbi:MAG: hypothetical protein JO125_11770, partial [Chloroflexi bacterium]|nr:hypothetical protein [Chloroflexota bacterium]
MEQVQDSAVLLDNRPEDDKEEHRNSISNAQTTLPLPSLKDVPLSNSNDFPTAIEYDLEDEYDIKKHIISASTHILVIYYEPSNELLYLKMWKSLYDRVYDTSEVTKRQNYLVDGLAFNCRFAPDVHLGIIPIRRLDDGTVSLGRLIEKPIKSQLEANVEYAAVMRRLHDEWQLSFQLERGIFSHESDFTFLAREVVRIHQQLKTSPYPEMGGTEWLYKKLQFVIDQLRDFLEQRPLFYEECQDMIDILLRTYELYKIEGHFNRRREKGHIKHCHGDLKAANLWIHPGCKEKKQLQHLLALDCIDFNHPEFCHIDTLSDVAMLAVDIETYLTYLLGKEKGQHLVKGFLNSYLEAMDEKGEE